MKRIYLLLVLLMVVASFTVVDSPEVEAHGDCDVRKKYFYSGQTGHQDYTVWARGAMDCTATHDWVEVYVALHRWRPHENDWYLVDFDYNSNTQSKDAGGNVKGSCVFGATYRLRVYGETGDDLFPFTHADGPRNWKETFTRAECTNIVA